MTDVTVAIVFHNEGAHALPALASMRDSVEAARSEGLSIEALAMLDQVDDRTRGFVARQGDWLDGVHEVAAGDLGLTRNAAARLARGRYMAFLDGDDLWGRRWIAVAYAHAAARAPAIWHPQYVYFFDQDGYDRHSATAAPHPNCRAAFGLHVASDAPDFDPRSLIFANAWTANALALRELYLRFPYEATDIEKGIGFEDWGWNIETLSHGVQHLVAPSTVHAIRRRPASLSMQLQAAGVLPRYSGAPGATQR